MEGGLVQRNVSGLVGRRGTHRVRRGVQGWVRSRVQCTHCIGPFGTVFLNSVIPHVYFKSIEIHPLHYMEDGDPFVTYST